MCSTSKVNDELLRAVGANSSSSSSSSNHEPYWISAVQLRHNRQKFYLIDIREPEEIGADPLNGSSENYYDDDDDDDDVKEKVKALQTNTITADIEVPLGKLLAAQGGVAPDWIQQDAVVLLCSTGYRSGIAARELRNHYSSTAFPRTSSTTTTKILALQRGLIGLRNPAATVPDTVVVLATKSNAEKITLALHAAAVAASSQGSTTVLCLMGDGICTMLRKGNNKEMADASSLRVEEIFIGEPFQPCQALLAKLVGSGNGVVLGCTTCATSRSIAFGSDLLDCVQPMQMPDLLRMLGEARKTLQFM